MKFGEFLAERIRCRDTNIFYEVIKLAHIEMRVWVGLECAPSNWPWAEIWSQGVNR